MENIQLYEKIVKDWEEKLASFQDKLRILRKSQPQRNARVEFETRIYESLVARVEDIRRICMEDLDEFRKTGR